MRNDEKIVRGVVDRCRCENMKKSMYIKWSGFCEFIICPDFILSFVSILFVDQANLSIE